MTYDIDDILKFLPHRFPFVMIDRIIEQEYEKYAIGTKLIGANEPYLAGHFPDYPIVPGVMLVESIAQVAGFIMASDRIEEEIGDKKFLNVGFDNIKVKGQARPGDILLIKTVLLSKKMNLFRVSGKIYIRDVENKKPDKLIVFGEIKMFLAAL